MFPVWVEIVCCECASTTEGRTTFDSVPRTEMKKSARRHGWVLKTGEDGFADWFCPECLTSTLKEYDTP